MFVRGVPVGWAGLLAARGGRRVELPTYAFVRQRYWPHAVRGDVTRTQRRTGYPLLAAAVELAGAGGLVFTGRLSVGEQPWLADHLVLGSVVAPGALLVELAAWAGRQAACGAVEELTLEAPLVLPEDDGGVELQVRVEPPQADGRREVSVHARLETESAAGPAGWTQHASGLLAPASPADELADAELAGEWPPPGAQPVPVDGLYASAAAAGYGYGPVFQGVRAAWRRGDEVFAEVRLDEELAAEAARFGVHPALLDAVLHAAGLDPQGESGGPVQLPFAWSGVRVAGHDSAVLRARVARLGTDAITAVAAGPDGRVAVAVDRLVVRPVSAAMLAGRGTHHPSLFAVEWVPIPAPAADTHWAMVGADPWHVNAPERYAGLPDLAAATDADRERPSLVVACLPGDGDGVRDPGLGGAD
jgi:acyl transferase domain-containing protein